MWAFYKCCQRLYNDFKKSIMHKNSLCGTCVEFIAGMCTYFIRIISTLPYDNGSCRPIFLFEDTVEIWQKCPFKCINNFKMPLAFNREYSIKLSNIYHDY